MSLQFSEFPASYGYSQFGIGFVLVALAVGGPLIRIAPPTLKAVLFSILGVIALVSLVVSNCVVVRYPYISLVESEDGDIFSEHCSSF